MARRRVPARRGQGLWAPLVMPAAAFGVHQLRYYLAYGSGASAELLRTGHSYLHSVVPWLVAMVAAAMGGFLWSLGRAFAGHGTIKRYTMSLAAMWLVCSLALLGIFSVQEFLEGLLATGHPGGLQGIFGFGGWWAIPVSLCVGLVLATLFHGARWAVDEVARLGAASALRLPTSRPGSSLHLAYVAPVAPAPLVDGWCTRGPPCGSSLITP